MRRTPRNSTVSDGPFRATDDDIRRTIAYIKNDAFVAQYHGCDVARVRRLRATSSVRHEYPGQFATKTVQGVSDASYHIGDRLYQSACKEGSSNLQDACWAVYERIAEECGYDTLGRAAEDCGMKFR